MTTNREDASALYALQESHGAIGEVHKAQGSLTLAVQSFETELAIAERLANQSPGNSDKQREIYSALMFLADVEIARGKHDLALDRLLRGQDIMERLLASDPTNAGWQGDLSVAHSKVGDVLVAQGDLDRALEASRASFILEHVLLNLVHIRRL